MKLLQPAMWIIWSQQLRISERDPDAEFKEEQTGVAGEEADICTAELVL